MIYCIGFDFFLSLFRRVGGQAGSIVNGLACIIAFFYIYIYALVLIRRYHRSIGGVCIC